MSATILVTGATGNVGRETVQALSRAGNIVRAASRTVKPTATGENIRAFLLDYTDSGTYAAPLKGVAGLFLVAPPLDAQAPSKLLPFIKAVKASGVRHVVFVSALGVNLNEQAPLRILEHAVMDSGIGYTILRANFFMENFSTGFIAPTIRHQRGISLAAGEGKTSFISTKDIAAVAAKVFATGPQAKEYNLTGPEALDHAQVATILSRTIGREIRYHALSEDAMLQGARDQGLPEDVVQYLGALYAVVRAGYMATVTNDVESVTGTKPIHFEAFARSNSSFWK